MARDSGTGDRPPPRFLGAAVLIGLMGALLFVLSPMIWRQDGHPGPADAEAALVQLKRIVGFEYAFQSDLRIDEDGDGVGEFGTLAELAPGGPGWSATAPFLTDPAFALPEPIIRGHRFSLWLPDGHGASATRGAIRDGSPDGVRMRGLRFVAYAWPENCETDGGWILATDQTGRLWRSRNHCAAAGPSWDALYAQGWGSTTAPGWEPADR